MTETPKIQKTYRISNPEISEHKTSKISENYTKKETQTKQNKINPSYLHRVLAYLLEQILNFIKEKKMCEREDEDDSAKRLWLNLLQKLFIIYLLAFYVLRPPDPHVYTFFSIHFCSSDIKKWRRNQLLFLAIKR